MFRVFRVYCYSLVGVASPLTLCLLTIRFPEALVSLARGATEDVSRLPSSLVLAFGRNKFFR